MHLRAPPPTSPLWKQSSRRKATGHRASRRRSAAIPMKLVSLTPLLWQPNRRPLRKHPLSRTARPFSLRHCLLPWRQCLLPWSPAHRPATRAPPIRPTRLLLRRPSQRRRRLLPPSRERPRDAKATAAAVIKPRPCGLSPRSAPSGCSGKVTLTGAGAAPAYRGQDQPCGRPIAVALSPAHRRDRKPAPRNECSARKESPRFLPSSPR